MPNIKPILQILLLSGLALVAACAGQITAIALRAPAIATNQAPLCSGPDCPSLIITQSGQPGKINLSGQGIQPAPSFALPREQTQNGRWVIDTSLPSPDGQWVAYTSISAEAGGPVFLQNIKTGQWTNLIQALNTHLSRGRSPFPENAGWDVIGWFPDSQQLMIGPTDLSQVIIVNQTTFAARLIGFPGGGRGGRLFVNLSPDGSQFLYIGENDSGNQILSSYDLHSGQATKLLQLAYNQGVLYNPRFSPDQKQIAYLKQKGQPASGLAYSIELLTPGQSQPKVLVNGNLGMTIPNWSPDSRRIAFTRNQADQPDRISPKATPRPERNNIWTVAVQDGKQTQVTFMDQPVRSPVWAKDGKMLAFVTGDGQVRISSIDHPGESWQAVGPSANPELTSAFFLP